MKLKQHIAIGKLVYNEIVNSNTLGNNMFNIYKIPFLLGNIAPDLNCIYPAHRLRTTEKRFYAHLKTSASTDYTIVKSFVLGIITHYICDYFCYAHNNESIGVKHRVYETNLWNYYRAHMQELKETPSRIINEWKKHKVENINNNIKYNELNVDEQCKIIIEQIKRMNTEYARNTNIDKRRNWEQSESQLKYDLQYIIFMASHIDRLILEPFRCIAFEA